MVGASSGSWWEVWEILRGFEGDSDWYAMSLFADNKTESLAKKTTADRRNHHDLSPVGRSARQIGVAPTHAVRRDIAQPGGFCRGVHEGSGLLSSTRVATTARPAPAKQDCAS